MTRSEQYRQDMVQKRGLYSALPTEELVELLLEKDEQVLAMDGFLKVMVNRFGEAKKDSLHDPLTGVLNRRGFTQSFDNRVRDRRHSDEGSDFLLAFDLDSFKSINDQHGHNAGDETLKKVAGLISISVREKDTVGRLGGDEFAAIVTDTTARKAVNVAKRVLANAHAAASVNSEVVVPSLSIGIAQIPPDTKTSFKDTLEQADQALYQAKENGKNQAILWKPGQKVQPHLPGFPL